MALVEENSLSISENASWFSGKNSLNLMTKTMIFIKDMLCCYNWYLILCLLFLMLNMEHLLMMVFWLYNILECSFKFICKLAFTLCLKLRNPWNIVPDTTTYTMKRELYTKNENSSHTNDVFYIKNTKNTLQIEKCWYQYTWFFFQSKK